MTEIVYTMSGNTTITWERIGRTDMPKRDTKLQKLSETIHITVEELRGAGSGRDGQVV